MSETEILAYCEECRHEVKVTRVKFENSKYWLTIYIYLACGHDMICEKLEKDI